MLNKFMGRRINEMEMVKTVDNYEKNEEKLRKTKRMRMSTTTSGLWEVASAFNSICKIFFKKNVENIKDYDTFLEFSKSSIRDLLYNEVQKYPIKYNIKVEVTYEIPNTEVKDNRSFKTLCTSLY
jgi:hypothetical protein